MNDCDLDKLSIKPGKLSPAFKKDVTEYHATVASDVDKVTFDYLTSDSGACASVHGGEGGRTVALKEGEVNVIKVEVTAEDGTTKFYIVHIKRLSAKDATLTGVKLSAGTLSPVFNADVLEYYCTLPCNIPQLTVTPVSADSKIAVTVCSNKPDSPVILNVGETKIEVEVTSVDGSNKNTYIINVIKKMIPRYVKITDPGSMLEFEDPVSLSPFYRPISIRDSDPKHTFSEPIVSNLTRKSKFDPLNENPLGPNWRITDYEIDKKLSQLNASIPLTYGGSSETAKITELGEKLQTFNVTPKILDLKDKFKANAPLKHSYKERSWEKGLQKVFDETNPDKLCKMAEAEIAKYYQSIPKPGDFVSFPDGESPLDFLERAAADYAVAVKNKPKDPLLHLKLGMVLEERYYAEDMFGLKKEDGGHSLNLGDNLAAKESSKAEECDAICKLHGVDISAPLSLKLQAIDKEYHNLVNSGQGGKADHVQALFAWKSKQAKQEGVAAQKAEDEESCLGQAYLKYLDALSIDSSRAVYNFHVGRMLVVQGNYDDAVLRLEQTISWNPTHEWAGFYLGFALCARKSGAGERSEEAISYLLQGMEVLMTMNSESALKVEADGDVKKTLYAEDPLQNTNVHLLRGINELAKLLVTTPVKDAMSPEDICHVAALLSSHTLSSLARGDVYQQFEWILLDAHMRLLQIASTKQKDNHKLIASRCEKLLALIRFSSIPMNEELLSLQNKTCQTLVSLNPCNNQALYRLGAALLDHYDNSSSGDAADKLLDDARRSFEAAIALEGKPASGEPPEQLTAQQWWQDKLKEEIEKKKAAEAKTAPPPAGRGGTAARGAGAGRGAAGAAPRARGALAARGAAAPRGAARGGRGAPAARGAPAPRGGAAAARGGKAPAVAGKTAAKPAAKSPSATSASPPKEVDKPASPAKAEEAPATESSAPSQSATTAPINKKMYQTRLGLARVLTRKEETLADSAKYFHEVITMAPEVHDAYIEFGEKIAPKDPMAAVDVYCRFPLSDNPSFDDAYILGEIVRLLMKAEQYDDPRLGPNMIAYGKVMGLGVLEKYVQKLDDKFKTDLLKSVYAGVNGKSVDDPEMQAFFKFKCWI